MVIVKRPHKTKPTLSPQNPVDRDTSITCLIAGLNYLMVQAQAANLGTAARILCTAKEDLVYWAVDKNFHESSREQFINHHLFGPFGNGVAELIAYMSSMDGALLPLTCQQAAIQKKKL